MLTEQVKGFRNASSQGTARGENTEIDVELDQGLGHVRTDTGENHLRPDQGGGTRRPH